MIFSSVNFVLADEEKVIEDDTNIARIVFDKNGIVTNKNVERVEVGGSYAPVEIGGDYTIKRDGVSDATRFIYVYFDREFINAPEGRPVEITVKYYDIGKGKFTLSYNGVNQETGESQNKDSDIVYGSRTEERFRTHTFYMEDMRGVREYWGADFRIGGWSTAMGNTAEPFYIKEIEIKKVYMKEPVKITTECEYRGNIFGPDEDKKINVDFINDLGEGIKSDTEINYDIEDYNGNILRSGEVKLGEVTDETPPVTFDLNDITKFGVYTIKLKFKNTIKDPTGEVVIENETPIDFSVVNKCNFDERNQRQNVNAHCYKNGAERSIEIAGYAGFGAVRSGDQWTMTEMEKGKYSLMPQTQELVDLVKENKYNVKRHNSLNLMNKFYVRPGEKFDYHKGPKTDEAVEAYGKMAAWIADYNNAETFEIWNEYNLHNEEADANEQYAKMLKSAYTKIKAASPETTVVGMCTSQCETVFMRDVLEHGAWPYMDVVSFHPYDWSGGGYNLDRLETYCKNVDALFEEFGGKKPIYLTEVGQSTADCFCYTPEIDQGAIALKIYSFGVAKNLFEKIFWYDLHDDGVTTTMQEDGFGLVEYINEGAGLSDTAKPSFVVMAGMNKLMHDADPVGYLGTEDGLRASNFKNSKGENIAVIWTDDNRDHNIDLFVGTDEIEVLDMYTNSMGKMSAADGVYTLGVSKYPIYVKGNFSGFEAKKSEKGIDTFAIKATPNDAYVMGVSGIEADGLKVQYEGSDKLSVSHVENGKINVMTNSDAKDSYIMTLKMYDEQDKLLYLAQPNLKVTEPIEAYMYSSQISENDPNHWQICTNITNTSNTAPVSGECRIVEINEQKVQRAPIKFENLQAKNNLTLYLNLDEMVKKRNVRLKIKITLDFGYEKEIMQDLDFTCATYAKEKPVLDGVMGSDEWNSTWLTADSIDRVPNIDGWSGRDDVSIDCNLMWDEENLYMGAIVRDNIHYNGEAPSTIWRGDSIQFGIENSIFRNTLSFDETGASLEYTEIGIALVDGEPKVYRWSSQKNVQPIGEVTNFKACVKRHDDGKTIYEFAIPWSELFESDYVLDKNTVFGYSMLVNDNDGAGRRGWIEYNTGIGSQKDSTMFGRMKLIGG